MAISVFKISLADLHRPSTSVEVLEQQTILHRVISLLTFPPHAGVIQEIKTKKARLINTRQGIDVNIDADIPMTNIILAFSQILF